MRYSIEPRERRYVLYGFLYFAENIGKNLSNKYGQKLVDTAKKSAADALKTATKRPIQKSAEATSDLIGEKIANKIISYSKKYPDPQQSCIEMNLIMKYQKKDIYLHKKVNKLLMN